MGVTRLFALPPRFETDKERLDAGISRMRVQAVRGMPPHEMLGFQPDAFVPDGAKDRRRAPGCTVFRTRAPVHPAVLFCRYVPGVPDMRSYERILFLCSKNGNLFYQDARAKASACLTAGFETP